MDFLWRSTNGSKRSDDYDECQKMAMLNIRSLFFFQYIMKRSIQGKGNNIFRFTVLSKADLL